MVSAQKSEIERLGPAKTQRGIFELLRHLLEMHPKWSKFAWSISFLLFILVIPIAYLAWFEGLPRLFTWATDWKWLYAWFPILIVACVPCWAAMGAWAFFREMLDFKESVYGSGVESALAPLQKAEDDLEESLKDRDDAGLVPLIKYSAEHLKAYYKLGLRQAGWSFAISVVAMLIGFLFLLGGFAITYLDPEKVKILKTLNPNLNLQDIRITVIAGGAIIEFISALFLWVYRSSAGQLTYFYNRQIHTHNVIMCYRIASSMSEPDETKHLIVNKVLERTWTHQDSEPKGANWFQKLLPGDSG